MSVLQHITLSEVKAACRKLYSEGQLLAQCPTEAVGYQRVINGIDYRCAIGAALTDETLDLINNNDSHYSTLEEFDYRDGNPKDPSRTPFVTFPESDYQGLIDLQVAHDRWLYDKEDNENFLALIEE